MTSTYDALGMLYYRAKEDTVIRKLVLIIYDYAIEEIGKLKQDKLKWETWVHSQRARTIEKIYPADILELELKSAFLSDAHSQLDHTKEFHLRTVHQRLDYIIGRVCDWFVRYKDRKSFIDRFFHFADFRKPTRDRYPKVFKELLALVNSGVITIPEWDKRTLKKVEKW